MNRFDRQLRLWGGFGQDLLSKGQICFVVDRCDDPLLLEIQRHLLLAGISKYLIFHSGGQQTPVKDGFSFIDGNQELQALNPEIKPQWKFSTLSEIYLQDFKDISVIVLINHGNANVLQELSMKRENSVSFPPVFVAAVKYPLAYIYLWLKEVHFVLTSNPEYMIPDLRVNDPWDELLYYVNSLDFGQLREEELAEIPYPVILLKALRVTSQDECPLHQKLDHYYLKFSPQALGDSNYRQAKRYARQVCRSSELNKQRIQVLLKRVDLICDQNWHDSFNNQFVSLCRALGHFLDYYYELPLPDEFPDMEAGTRSYNDLKFIYHKKAQKDREALLAILVQLGFPDVPKVLVKKFCDNINYWTLLEPSYSECSIPEVCSSSALSKYINDQRQSTSVSEIELLENLLSIEESYKSNSLVDLYSGTAFLGGVVAQEIIKIVTHQYVPIDNTFVYNLISDESVTIRL